MPSIPARADQFKKFVYRSITYPIVLLVLFAAILSWRVLVSVVAERSVDASDKVIAKANYTLTLAVDEETGERGYLVDGDQIYLNRYNIALAKIGPAFDNLQMMVRHNSDQLAVVRRMRSHYTAWQNEVNYELNLSSTYPAQYRTYFDEGREKQLMDELRADFSYFIDSEQKLRDDRASGAENASTLTLISSAVLAVLFGLGLGIAWVQQASQFADHYEEVLTVSQRNLNLLTATLMSIGDAVLVTDVRGKITQMNNVAEQLTGWKFSDAYGMDVNAVFKTVDKTSRQPIESPVSRALNNNEAIAPADHVLLIRQDGSELSVDDSCAPIRSESGKLAGVVLVFRDISERKRAEQELERLYQREHRIAENLQRSLLSRPNPRLLPRLDVEMLYQPAWAEAKVGGDYYDIIVLPNGKSALIVGDVSGKGLKAASRTAEMKFTLRAYLRENDDVAEAVSRLNKFVCQSQSVTEEAETFFLCLAVILIDPTTGDATVGVYGAEPPLIVRADGSVEEVNTNGTPVGIFEDSDYVSVPINLNLGDMIVVATDGITEARKDRDFLGNAGLAELAANARKYTSLTDVGNAIVDGVKQFADNKLSDDMCLLLARRK